jgi:MFS family permease
LSVQLINRNYTRLWFGQAVSLIGDFMFDTTIALWIGTVLLAGRGDAPMAVSAVFAVAAASTLIVAPFAGVLVDRWDRRKTMLVADAGRAVLAAVLAVVITFQELFPMAVVLAVVYVVVFASTAAAQFFQPARFALIGDIVHGDADRAKASGIGQATLAVAAIVGPPVAAPLLFAVGVGWALWINVLTFLVSLAAILAVRVASSSSGRAAAVPAGYMRQLLDGLRKLRRSRVLVTLLVSLVICSLGTGALNALIVFFVLENLHADPALLGVLAMSFGTGTIVGALAAGRLVRLMGKVNVFCYGVLLTGLGMVVFARQTSLVLAGVSLVAIGIPLGALNSAFGPLLLSATPSEYLGRVMSVFTPAQRLADITSIAVAGALVSSILVDFHGSVLGQSVGRIDLVFTVGGLLVCAGGMFALIMLRRPTLATATTDTPARPLVRESNSI